MIMGKKKRARKARRQYVLDNLAQRLDRLHIVFMESEFTRSDAVWEELLEVQLAAAVVLDTLDPDSAQRLHNARITC